MYIKTKNKAESDAMINKLKLNNFSEIWLENFDKKAIMDFFKQNAECDIFSLRGKRSGGDKIGGNENRNISKEAVLERTKQFKNFIIVAVHSSWSAHKLFTGAIKITEDESGDLNIILEGSNLPKVSGRDAMALPTHKIVGSLFDKKIKCQLDRINGINQMIDYVFKHDLLNVLIGFRVYDVPVGRYKQNIVVSDLRTHF